MATFVEGVKNALRTFPCFALKNGAYAYGSAARIFPLSPAGSIANGINRMRRLLGCDPTEDPPDFSPPFSGGQCPTLYTVQANASVRVIRCTDGAILFEGPVSQVGRTNVQGPIQSITRRGINFGNCGPRNEVVEVTNANGSVLPVGTLAGTSSVANRVEYFDVSYTVSRQDGQPDDCGSPPPDYPPPSNINVDIDVTYNIEEGPDITVTVPFTFSPITVDLSGNFSAPFTFNFGGLDFSGTLEISPEFNVRINPPTAPRGTDDDTDDLPPGDPGDEVEPVPSSEKVIGVAVISALVGEQQLTTIATQNIPRILAPRAGSIKFAYSLGISTFWSDDIDIKSDRTFIPCPFPQGADAVAVSPAPGVTVQWKAITGYPLATVADVA